MAFEELGERLGKVVKWLKGQTRLSEKNMDEMLQEIRKALLEADVNFKVVKNFLTKVKEESLGAKVLDQLNPAQTILKIVSTQMTEALGGDTTSLSFVNGKLTTILVAGLVGSGKTTTVAKLAYYLKNHLHLKVLVTSVDVYRFAAFTQLQKLCDDNNIAYFDSQDKDVAKRAVAAKTVAYDEKYDVLIVDTAGRGQQDTTMMAEIKQVSEILSPQHQLLVLDAMSGQDIVNVVAGFQDYITLTGVLVSKLDGSGRGGAIFSVKYLTNLPIYFSGTGEKINELEVFHPDRVASRILGQGDMLTLIDKIQDNITEKDATKVADAFNKGTFDLNMFIEQMQQIKKMGSLGSILKFIPGMPKIDEKQQQAAIAEVKLFESIIYSMTPYERKHPEVLKHSHKLRIGKGAGVTSEQINRLLKKFESVKQMSKQMKGMTGNKKPSMADLQNLTSRFK
jgi:signal recognition particle subunit SRP54